MSRFALILVMFVSTPAIAEWKPLASGLDYQKLPKQEMQAFRIALDKIRLEIIQAPKKGRNANTVASLAQNSNALVAINGGFFTRKFQPLGLLISRGVQLNPLRKADWGVFSITRDRRAEIVHTRRWKRHKSTDFAIQVGPRLVVNGRPLKLKEQKARRTAVGILPSGRQIIIVVVDRDILTQELANKMVNIFGCTHALNLDGGTSTQLWSKFPAVKPISGFRVTNALVAIQR